MKKIFFSLSTLLIATVSVANPLDDVSKNLDIFNSLFRSLYISYVDTIPTEKIVKAGIDGMLQKLDPYTVYIPESEDKEFKLRTTGEYAGVGALVGMNKADSIYIVEAYDGLPAVKAGLKTGDIILEVDGKSMVKKTTSDASSMLRGMPGTKVSVKIKRYGIEKPLKFEITREKITLNPVKFSGMVSDSIGLIKLSSFYEDSYDEVKKAYLGLKKQGIKAFILDLRGNPGGILGEASNICNMFLPKGTTVVSTKGKFEENDVVYKTAYQPIDTEIPVVVLVNGGSASASEIVSGALQDLDRAVIMGQRTFGKGLVQQTRSLPYEGMLKVTVAKYYTPSGRCIQEINYTTKDGEKSEEIPDSLTTEYKTRAGRVVRDGRGIMPDVKLDSDTSKLITYNLILDGYVFNWATQYYYTHSSLKDSTDFEISDSDFNAFKQYVIDKDFKYRVSTKNFLKDFIDAAKYEGVYEPNKALFDTLEVVLEHNIPVEMDSAKEEICQALASEVILRYYYDAGKEQYLMNHDEEVKQAVELLLDDKKYKNLLK